MNILIWFIIIGICAFILLITLFSIVVEVSFSLGMRNKDDAHYDPETKQWYAMVELSEEQQSRIVVGKRRLLRRNIEPKKTLRSVMWLVAIVLIICIVVMLICNQIVVNNAKGKVFSDIDSIKHNKVGLLLGTTPQARIGRITNYFFVYRIDAAEQLYKAGKIEMILISGDENSLDGVNETECMRDSLVVRGVPASAIILDGKGYRTICSVVNANKVYGLKSFTIISQKFHNERAIYQAEHLGLDIENIQAYNAKDPKSRRAYLTTIREYFARVKMFLDLMTAKTDR